MHVEVALFPTILLFGSIMLARAFRPLVLVALLTVQNPLNADEPYFASRLIFPLQAKHVHSSCVIECPNGDLMATWFYGSGERDSPDVLIQGARLRQGATAWSEPFLMADTPNAGGWHAACLNGAQAPFAAVAEEHGPRLTFDPQEGAAKYSRL